MIVVLLARRTSLYCLCHQCSQHTGFHFSAVGVLMQSQDTWSGVLVEVFKLQLSIK